jgi:hypothetical protein
MEGWLMRWVIYLLGFFYLFEMREIASAGSGSRLPDYQNEARMVFQGLCDDGKVSYNTYHKQGGYILEVARIQSEGSFYFMKRYLGDVKGWEEHYFIQITDSSNPQEFSHEAWDEKVKQTSFNYFNKLHNLETTCSKVLVM